MAAVNKRNAIFGLALWLISLGVIAAYAFFIYELSHGGTSRIIGQVLGGGLLVTLILWFAAKKYSYWLRVSLGVLAGTLLMAFQNWNELEMAIDGRVAQPLIAAAKTEEEFARVIAENPNNKVLRVFGVTLANALDTKKQVAELYAKMEPEDIELLNKSLDTLSGSELVTVARALRVAQRNALDAANSIGSIYDGEIARDMAALNSAGDSSVKRGAISGVKDRHARERPFLVKSFHASEAFYGAMADQAEFLLVRQGAYSKTAEGLAFMDHNAVEQWNELYRKTQSMIAQYNAVEKERAELEQFQANVRAELRKQ